MPEAIVIRKDYPSAELRRLARSSNDGQQVRRLLALAAHLNLAAIELLAQGLQALHGGGF